MGGELSELTPDSIKFYIDDGYVEYSEEYHSGLDEDTRELAQSTAETLEGIANQVSKEIEADLYIESDVIEQGGVIATQVEVRPEEEGSVRNYGLCGISYELMSILAVELPYVWEHLVESTSEVAESSKEYCKLSDIAEQIKEEKDG